MWGCGGVGFGVWGLGFRGVGYRVQGLASGRERCKVQGLGVLSFMASKFRAQSPKP